MEKSVNLILLFYFPVKDFPLSRELLSLAHMGGWLTDGSEDMIERG